MAGAAAAGRRVAELACVPEGPPDGGPFWCPASGEERTRPTPPLHSPAWTSPDRRGASPARRPRRRTWSLRPLSSLDQFDDAIGIMVATWGAFQLPPREVMTALAHSGNVPLGAYDGERLVGFVLGWAGVDEEGLHVHSHMLAALPERRHRGVGYALKLGQRAQALDQDIHVARWTFDPLVARNAWFNLGKLGAVADRFGRDFYGEMTDEINRGDRTDRLVVRWDLDPDPAPRSVAGRAPDRARGRRRSRRSSPGGGVGALGRRRGRRGAARARRASPARRRSGVPLA